MCRNLAAAMSYMHRVRLPNRRCRRLTVGEGTRLQNLPEWFTLPGTEVDMCNQIGNAPPPLSARALARGVAACLERRCGAWRA